MPLDQNLVLDVTILFTNDMLVVDISDKNPFSAVGPGDASIDLLSAISRYSWYGRCKFYIAF